VDTPIIYDDELPKADFWVSRLPFAPMPEALMRSLEADWKRFFEPRMGISDTMRG